MIWFCAASWSITLVACVVSAVYVRRGRVKYNYSGPVVTKPAEEQQDPEDILPSIY